MIIHGHNKRLIHAMVFFIENTKYCYSLKLFKLLYFLDCKHFKQTGNSVTGQKYFAWPTGPIPKKLYNEIKNPSKIKDFFQIIQKEFEGYKPIQLIPKIDFNRSLFSQRQIEIMNELVVTYRNVKFKNMTSASHEKNNCWDKVFNKENKKYGLIPYEYILDNSKESISKDMVEEIDQDNKGLERAFGSMQSLDLFNENKKML